MTEPDAAEPLGGDHRTTGADAGTELVLTPRRLPPYQVEAHRSGRTDMVRDLSAILAGRQISG